MVEKLERGHRAGTSLRAADLHLGDFLRPVMSQYLQSKTRDARTRLHARGAACRDGDHYCHPRGLTMAALNDAAEGHRFGHAGHRAEQRAPHSHWFMDDARHHADWTGAASGPCHRSTERHQPPCRCSCQDQSIRTCSSTGLPSARRIQTTPPQIPFASRSPRSFPATWPWTALVGRSDARPT